MSSLLLSAAAKLSLSLLQSKTCTHPSLRAPRPVQLLALSPPLDVLFITGIKLSNKV